LLIAHGADVNIATESGSTPILIAAGLNQWDQVLVLLEAGAKYNIEDNSHTNFMKILKKRNDLIPPGMEQRRKVIEWLEKNKGEVFGPDWVR
jgi:hypothetical protein